MVGSLPCRPGARWYLLLCLERHLTATDEALPARQRCGELYFCVRHTVDAPARSWRGLDRCAVFSFLLLATRVSGAFATPQGLDEGWAPQQSARAAGPEARRARCVWRTSARAVNLHRGVSQGAVVHRTEQTARAPSLPRKAQDTLHKGR